MKYKKFIGFKVNFFHINGVTPNLWAKNRKSYLLRYYFYYKEFCKYQKTRIYERYQEFTSFESAKVSQTASLYVGSFHEKRNVLDRLT